MISSLSGFASVVGGGTMAVTAIADPFLGMVAGLVVKLLGSMIGFHLSRRCCYGEDISIGSGRGGS